MHARMGQEMSVMSNAVREKQIFLRDESTQKRFVEIVWFVAVAVTMWEVIIFQFK